VDAGNASALIGCRVSDIVYAGVRPSGPLMTRCQVITYAQLERLEDLSVSMPDRVKIIKKARVTKLVKDESGAVIGVEYELKGKTEKALGPVVLATGGYAADFTETSLLKKYRPEYYDLPTTNGDHCTGDGHKLALAIGASAIDLEKVQVHPTGLVDPKDPEAKVKFLAAEALRGVGGLLLDNTGSRFVDELQHRDYVTGKMWENGKVRHGDRAVPCAI
jgi:succinate dehydrogenase/fumarate reductase flavoprotein subunit